MKTCRIIFKVALTYISLKSPDDVMYTFLYGYTAVLESFPDENNFKISLQESDYEIKCYDSCLPSFYFSFPAVHCHLSILFNKYLSVSGYFVSEFQWTSQDFLTSSLHSRVFLRAEISSVQSLSGVQLFVTPWTAACQASLSILTPGVYSNSCPLSRWCHLSHPLLSPSPPTFNLSQGLFQWVSSSHQVAKLCCFSFSISPSNEYSGLISFRMDWLDLLAVQGTLKSLLQHYSSKASILWCSAFFIVQLSHPYMSTGKTIALTRWNSKWKLRHENVTESFWVFSPNPPSLRRIPHG